MPHLYRLLFRNPISVLQLKSKVIPVESLSSQALSIRTMTYEELGQTCSNWAKKEGWPSVRYSLPAMYSLDPEGFYFLETPEDNSHSTFVVQLFGFEKVLRMHKMYKGEEPRQDQKRTFCYSSLVSGG